jgi:hypothetical protein
MAARSRSSNRAHTLARLCRALLYLCAGATCPPVLAPSALAQAPSSPSAQVERVLRAYASLATPTVDTLVALDRALRLAVPCCHAEHARRQTQGVVWQTAWARVGVEWNGWDPDVVEYNGRLLREAHERDPWSRRSETLYAATYPRNGPEATETTYGVPDRDTLELYLRAFPRGPHAIDAARLLAFLYSDLAEVLRLAASDNDEVHAAKAECFKRYIARNRPRTVQYRAALENARRAFAIWKQLAPNDPIARAGVQSSGGSSWYFCPD